MLRLPWSPSSWHSPATDLKGQIKRRGCGTQGCQPPQHPTPPYFTTFVHLTNWFRSDSVTVASYKLTCTATSTVRSTWTIRSSSSAFLTCFTYQNSVRTYSHHM